MAGVKFLVQDTNGNPIQGGKVVINACKLLTVNTDNTGVATASTCDGWGGPFTYTVTANGYQEVNGQISKPFYPWTTINKTVVMNTAPVSVGPNGTCPTGYTLNASTGLCEANASINSLLVAEDWIKSHESEAIILAVIAGVIYVIYKVAGHKDQIMKFALQRSGSIRP